MKFSMLILLVAVRSTVNSTSKQMNDIQIRFRLLVSFAEHHNIKRIIFYRTSNSDLPISILIQLFKLRTFFVTTYDRHQFLDSISGDDTNVDKMLAVYFDMNGSCCTQLNFVSKWSRIKWLVITRSSSLDMNDTFFPFNSEFVVAQAQSDGTLFQLTEVYQTRPDSRKHWQVLGIWDEVLRLTNESFFRRRVDFLGEEVIIKPYMTVKTGAGASFIPTYVPSIWDTIRGRINAKSVDANDSSLFDIDINLSLPDEIGQPLPVFLKVRSRLYYKEGSSDFALSRYFRPFSLGIWLCVIFGVVQSSVGLIIINKCKAFIKEDIVFFFLDAFYICVQQGSQFASWGFSSATVKVVQLALALCIFATYSGVFISFVTVSIFLPPFNNLEGILKDGRYNILTIEKAGYGVFKSSPKGVVRHLLENQIGPVETLPKNFSESFSRACDGKHKFLVEIAASIVPYYLRNIKEGCRISSHSIPLTTLKETFRMPIGNRYYEIFKMCVTTLLESGAIGDIYWSKAVQQDKPVEDEVFDSISIDEASSLFLFLIIGMFASVIVFLFEIWFKMLRISKSSDDTV